MVFHLMWYKVSKYDFDITNYVLGYLVANQKNYAIHFFWSEKQFNARFGNYKNNLVRIGINFIMLEKLLQVKTNIG